MSNFNNKSNGNNKEDIDEILQEIDDFVNGYEQQENANLDNNQQIPLEEQQNFSENEQPNQQPLNTAHSDNEQAFEGEDFTPYQEEQPIAEQGMPINEIKKIAEKDLKAKKVKKAKKPKGCVQIAVWIASIIVIAVGISAFLIMSLIDVMGITLGAEREYEVIIPKGASTEQIADILHDSHVIKFPFIFRIYSRLTGNDGTYQYGAYYVKNSMGYEGIVSKIQSIGSNAKQVKVTIPEGSSLNEIIKLLDKHNVCTESEFKRVMKKEKYNYKFIEFIPSESVLYLFEGYLYPETYFFFESEDGNGEVNAQRAINKMLSVTDDKITDDMYKSADELGYTIHEIMTMASIIELEASGYPDEMKKVAQVFYNRLKWDEPKLLGSTPTSKYPSSRYDTNKVEGLPPGPLCSPSQAAINAALNPDKSITETYFVTDKRMKFYYTSSLSEHYRIINNLKKQGLWEY